MEDVAISCRSWHFLSKSMFDTIFEKNKVFQTFVFRLKKYFCLFYCFQPPLHFLIFKNHFKKLLFVFIFYYSLVIFDLIYDNVLKKEIFFLSQLWPCSQQIFSFFYQRKYAPIFIMSQIMIHCFSFYQKMLKTLKKSKKYLDFFSIKYAEDNDRNYRIGLETID